ncbi:type II toxin-antitoxin system RelE/ParE family toxin [Acetobacterium sp.]|uniref:type II toxin-antitoxin system RelE/ParE family toxin n=1 Tax=Acetobacterium sp. TaxID=1872094 RepID=UPI002F42E9AA
MVKNKFSIAITPKANEDLDEIYGYIANELSNESVAENLMDKIETKIMRLQDFPLSGCFVEDEILRVKGYHKLIIENFIAFYIVNKLEKRVIIMRGLYGRQKYQDII